jgi:predicted NUDIX family phosphoesterase
VEHQTTIELSFYYIDLSKKEIISKLEGLKSFILNKSATYGFQLSMNNETINGNDANLLFTDFINFINENVIEDDGVIIENYGIYEADILPDLEDGEIEFSSSLCIGDETISIYLNTNEFYASELKKFENQSLGISGAMNDIDGDYFEFEI